MHRIFGSSPSKALEENDGGRIPLCPIQDSSADQATISTNIATPRRGKRAMAFNPLSENGNGNVGGTPEKRPQVPMSLKAKFGWNASGKAAVVTVVDKDDDQVITEGHHGKGGPSQYSTPRAAKIDHKHWQMLSEPGNNLSTGQSNHGTTPKKGVSRSLKYQDASVARMTSSKPKSIAAASDGAIVPGHFDLVGDSSFWEDHNVQVLIRIRPFSSNEVGLGRSLRQDTAHSLTWIGPPEARFTFDHVACESITQEKLFTVAGLPMVENCISGYNNCMFAYGQTGSGKTHTMLGDISDLDQHQNEERGMIPRVFEYLFERVEKEAMGRTAENLRFICKCSFLEIYNEQITDLLEPNLTNLQLREDVKKGVYVDSLTEVEVRNVQDVIKLLLQGSANRKVAATSMNRESSRSHSVFTCIVESKWERDSVINTRFGRLNLVDLAGSERQKSSGAEGDRLREAANINKSLSTLGLVIMVLVDTANGKPRHVPYRDSKLTFLLQDSLGGNSKTMIIATVSPSGSSAMETLSTLKFAQRAKFIRNNAIVNEDTFGDVVALRQQIQQLKEELNHYRSRCFTRRSLDEQETSESNILGKLGQDVLAGSLRRESVAESVIKNLTTEMEHLQKLVKQREEDTQRVKMVLRFREDKIRRMEAVTEKLVSPDEYILEEKNALLEEIRLLRDRVDHNPEVTRFAMENIRLMHELKRLQEFTDTNEHEILAVELATLRDQLLELLDARDEHARLVLQNEELRSELHEQLSMQASSADENRRVKADNEQLSRKIHELEEQMNRQAHDNRTMKHDLDMAVVKLHNIEVDQEAHMNTISGLKILLQQSEESKALEELKSSELDVQLKEALETIEELETSLKEERDVQEQLEAQSLFLMKELEAVLQQDQAEDRTGDVLKEQLQSLQLELQKRDEIRSLEREVAVSRSSDPAMEEVHNLELLAKLQQTKQELEEAQELNTIFIGEQARRLALEKVREATRSQVEAETAEAIDAMHRELEQNSTSTIVEEMKRLEDENRRLVALCEEKDQETEKLVARKLAEYVDEQGAVFDTADEVVDDIPLEKKRILDMLQAKLREAFVVVRDAEVKIRALTEANVSLTEAQEKRECEMEAEREDAVAELRATQSALRKAEKVADVTFVVIDRLADMKDTIEMQSERCGARCRSLEAELSGVCRKAEAAFVAIDHFSSARDALREEARELLEDKETELEFLRYKRAIESQALEETEMRLQAVYNELAEEENTKSDAAARLEEAEHEKEQLLDRVEGLRAELDMAMQENEVYMSKLEAAKGHCACMEDVVNGETRACPLKQEVLALQCSIQEDMQQMGKINSLVAAALEENEGYRTKLAEAENKCACMADALKAGRDESMGLGMEIQVLQAALDGLAVDVSDRSEREMLRLRELSEVLEVQSAEVVALRSETSCSKAALEEDLKDVRCKLRELEAEVVDGKAALSSKAAALDSLRLTSGEKQQQIEELSAIVAAQAERLHSLQDAIDAAQSELRRSEERAGLSEAAMSEIMAEHSAAVEELRKGKEQVEEGLRGLVSEAVFTSASFKGEVWNVFHDLRREMLLLKEDSVKCGDVLGDLESARRSLRQSEDSLRQSQEHALMLECELASTKSALESAELAEGNYGSEIASLKEDLERLQQEAAIERAYLESAIRNGEELVSQSRCKNAELVSELGRREEMLAELRCKNEELSSELGRREELLLESECKNRELSSELQLLSELRCKNLELSSELQRREEQLSELRCKNEELSSELSELLSESECKESELHLLSEFRCMNGELSTALQRSDEQLSEIRCKNEQLSSELASTKSALESAELNSATEIAGLKDALERAVIERTDLQNAEELLSQYRCKQEGLSADLDKTGELLSQARCRNGELSSELQKREDLISQCRCENEQLSSDLQRCEALLTESRSKNEEVSSELSQCRRKYEELSAELEKSERRCQLVEKDCVAAVEEMNDLDVKIQKLDEMVTASEQENAQLLRDIEKKNAIISALERQRSGGNEALESENTSLKEMVRDLEELRNNLEAELEEKQRIIESLDQELLELSSMAEQKIAESVKDLNDAARERDKMHTDLLVLAEQLEMVQATADERELVATEARQIAEVSKAHAEEKEEEVKVLERSVGELESTVNALEGQVGNIKREAQTQRLMREDLEMELQALRMEISRRNATAVERTEEPSSTLSLREEIAKLNEDCVEKDAQIQAYKKHIVDLMTASARQAAQHQQKIEELESCLDQARSAKTKGSGSPFKCLSLSQQKNSENDEEISAARRRIHELEAAVSARQTEVYMLNARLAEAESMTHDIVRDLLGVKMDMTNCASMLSQRKNLELKNSSELSDACELRKQLEEFIAERESWLEEIKRRQAEIVALRVTADGLRGENEKLKEENSGVKKVKLELEHEVRKLSGQQNLQQRIHHHAKIKEENNGLKMQNEELSTRLRRAESRLNRVNDELRRYRASNGMTSSDFDEEDELRHKLKEAENDKLQLAEKLTTLCAKIMQTAGRDDASEEINPSTALASLQSFQNKLREKDQELADLKLKTKIAGEKRRLSELKAQASPVKNSH